jgi:hypothetical protein
MTENKPRLLKRLCVYKNGTFIGIDLTPEFVCEDEVDSYLTEAKSKEEVQVLSNSDAT